MVLDGVTIRRSIVGTQNDLVETLAFAADEKLRTHYGVKAIENTNSISDCMRRGLNEAPRSKLRGITELNFEDSSEAGRKERRTP